MVAEAAGLGAPIVGRERPVCRRAIAQNIARRLTLRSGMSCAPDDGRFADRDGRCQTGMSLRRVHGG